VAVEDFLQKGYLPEALNNFVALLGWNPGTDQEIFSMENLIATFLLDKVNKSGAVFDIQKLNWMNGQYIRQLSTEEKVEFLKPYLLKAGFPMEPEDTTRKILESAAQRISYGAELKKEVAIFYQNELEIEDEEAREIMKQESAQEVLTTFLQKLDNFSKISIDEFKTIMSEVQQETGYKKQELWMPIRVGLTGVTHGPDLPLVIEIFGKSKIQNFMQQAIKVTSEFSEKRESE
jgi:glutamyl/glutaminyl-tRNA synthetase